MQIPEERIPWEPPKMFQSRRSRSVPPQPKPKTIESETETQVQHDKKIDTKPEKIKSAPQRAKSCKPKVKRPKSKKLISEPTTQSIILSRGDLRLAVNFPVDTLVKLKDGPAEKFILRSDCQCKAIQAY